jgi:hypothetical protein
MPTLPPGVTLQQIDGGPNYYANNGFTYAHNAGWDDSFFPIGPWLASIGDQSDVNRWKDLGFDTAFTLTADSSLSLLRSNNISAILQRDELDRFGSLGPETVGILSADEPSTYSNGVSTPLSTTPNSVQDGRFWWMNNTHNILQGGDLGGVPTSQVLSNLITTPNGTNRHIDAHSTDLYWFAGAEAPFWRSVGGDLYGLGRDATSDEMSRGSNYGFMVDWARSYQTTYSIPIFQFVETGGPYTEDTSASNYITPPELNWAVWSSIIHGARGIIYFNHTFAGPGDSFDNVADPYYQTVQPGQTISIYDQVKATDALVEQLAPVLNSPTALGYVTVSPTPTTFNGIETMAKDYNGQFYIFADTRDSETQTNIPATFTINDPNATSVTVVNENRTIPVTNGVFTDTFARAWTEHIYQVNDGSSGGSPENNPPAITSSGGGATAVVSIAETTTAVTTVAATDPDAGQTLSYSIVGGADASKFTINATTGALAFGTAPNFEAPTDAGANNVYDVTVQVSDGNGGSDAQAIAVAVTNVNEPGTGNVVAAINIGGGAYTAVESGINYVADPGPATGTITYRDRSGDPIGGTQDDSLYQTYGFGDFAYAIAVPQAGNYAVQIELIEPFWQAAGSRLFDVALEGSVPTGFNDIDIYALAGGQFQALTLTETVTVSDGTLDLDFNTLVDNSLVSAMEVYKVSGGSPAIAVAVQDVAGVTINGTDQAETLTGMADGTPAVGTMDGATLTGAAVLPDPSSDWHLI